MKILHIINSLGDGGAERVLFNLAFNDIKNEHTIIILNDDNKYYEDLNKKKIKIININFKYNYFNIFKLIQLYKIIKNQSYDIIQTWMYISNILGSLVSLVLNEKPVIWNIRHSNINFKFKNIKTIFIIYLNLIFSYFFPKKIICCSQQAIKWHEKLGFKKNKFIYIPNGVDILFFKKIPLYQNKYKDLKKNKIILSLVGRFHKKKGHEFFLKVFRDYTKKNNENIKLILIGSSLNNKDKLIKLINQLQISNNVILMENTKYINHIYSITDLLISPSIYGEGFPNVVAESMACNTPCLVSNSGDSKNIIGDCGWSFETLNHKDLIDKLEQSISFIKTSDIKDLKIKCRNIIEKKFSLNSMLKNYTKFWKTQIK